jgi:hypothetical protein
MHYLPFALLLTVLPVTTPTPPLGFNVEVQPSFMDPYMLLTATAIVERGKSETTKAKNGEYSVEFTVTINAAGDRAETRVVVQRSGAIVGEQRSSTALMKPPSVGGR